MGVRSFDAPGRAGTVLYQDSTAASSSGGRAFSVEMRPMGARKGSEDRSSAEELPVVPQPSWVERAATIAVRAWADHTTSSRGCAEAWRTGRMPRFAGIRPLDGGTASTKAGGESRDSPPARAVLAGRAEHCVAVVAQHGAGGIVGDDQGCRYEVGEKEQLTGSA